MKDRSSNPSPSHKSVQRHRSLNEQGFGLTRSKGFPFPFFRTTLHDPHDHFAGFDMHCFVYASQRKANTYLWLAQKDNFKAIPASLAVMLGDLRFVLEVELHAQRRLPYEDVEVVMEHLRTQGWHLQLPPQETLATGSAAADREELSEQPPD
jgi:uncharacterized protein